MSGAFARTSSLWRRGTTMPETLLVLGIVAIVLGGLLYLYNQMAENSRNREVIQEVMVVHDVVRRTYGEQSNYGVTPGNAVDLTDSLARSGQLPPHMVRGTVIHHSLGGQITVTAYDAGVVWGGVSLNQPTFVIALESVPEPSCIPIMKGTSGGAITTASGYTAGGYVTNGIRPHIVFGGFPPCEGLSYGAKRNLYWQFR